jgi:hypothetical protein
VTAHILPFPRRAPLLGCRRAEPFAVEVMREYPAWLVRCRDHGWLHGSRQEALADVRAIAAGWDVGVVVRLQ